jgi:thiol:disulfide interchange protein
MLNRRNIIALSAFAVFAPAAIVSASAATTPAYTKAAFEAAKKDGKSILIAIHADWCPTCKAQKPIVDSLLDSDKFKNVVSFRVDFDAQADDVREFGAQMQSTLITFKGDKEMGRSVGETDPAAIETLLATAL